MTIIYNLYFVKNYKNHHFIIGYMRYLLILLLLVGCAPPMYNFQNCEDAGYPITDTYPRQCRTPDGDVFFENVEEKETLITLDLPDEPVERIPTIASVKYVVEHRSGLKGNSITIQGVVIESIIVDSCTVAGVCSTPKLIIADTQYETDENYKVMIILKENAKEYEIGEYVTFEVMVDAAPEGLILKELY